MKFYHEFGIVASCTKKEEDIVTSNLHHARVKTQIEINIVFFFKWKVWLFFIRWYKFYKDFNVKITMIGMEKY